MRQLQHERCMFRLSKRSSSPFIWIRRIEKGKEKEKFSSKFFRADNDEHIKACVKACLRCHKNGIWDKGLGGELSKHGVTWDSFAQLVLSNLRARVEREGSRKNAETHLKEIAQFTGIVSSQALLDWVKQRDPIENPGAFRNRIETLSHIQQAKHLTGLDVSVAIKEAKELKPTGAAKKQLDQESQKIHAIPTDKKLKAWLDRLEGHEQWLCAMIAVYGLRPSEAWHVEQIDQDGWAVIPGDGKTKTKRHIAPPVPVEWLSDYKLKENFDLYQKQINSRWRIRWSEKGIPLNNSAVSNSLWRQLYRETIPKLWIDDEWVRPYDLRHSYAIRLFTSEEVRGNANDDFARWMGHGVDVHERVYLRHMSSTREDDALKARFVSKRDAAPEPQPEQAGVFISQEEYEKIQAIKKMLGSN